MAERGRGKQVVVYLSDEEHRALKVKAAEHGTTMSGELLDAWRAANAQHLTSLRRRDAQRGKG